MKLGLNKAQYLSKNQITMLDPYPFVSLLLSEPFAILRHSPGCFLTPAIDRA
jgi:hypothetical protein